MRQIAYCGDHIGLAFTIWGDKIYVDTRDTSLAPHILLEGDWEPWVTKCFLQYLSEMQGATVIDVGANFGWYTLIAAHFGASKVFAFEPQLALCELLLRSVKVNGYTKRVQIFPFGCSDAADVLRLSLKPDEIGGARILRQGESTPEEGTVTTTVPVVQLDAELCYPDFKLVPAGPVLIKIDVEGHEPRVIAGAQKLIKAYHPVLFIEHHNTEDARRMLDYLQGLGYVFHRAEHKGYASGVLTIEQAMTTGDAETLICEVPR